MVQVSGLTSPDQDTEGGLVGHRIRIKGTVQGVGFRPTVWHVAGQCAIKGRVLNDGSGVLIEAWGTPQQLRQFVQDIYDHCPPLARIETLEETLLNQTEEVPSTFEIAHSQSGTISTNISPDAATCSACLTDVLIEDNRRFRYPFANCTHCGPRLSIIKALPYDRPKTSMASFVLCKKCLFEYQDPADRRFHAQPNACSECGPRVWLVGMHCPEAADAGPAGISSYEIGSEKMESPGELDDITRCADLLKQGKIVAIKGIGGFHLAVDATNEAAVARLRSRKQRYHKPFALMAREEGIIAQYCMVTKAESHLLNSTAAPIVVLATGDEKTVAPSVAPQQTTLGFMLPYTPLHHLLLQDLDIPIVLTSGNRSDEPQCLGNEEAAERLKDIADYMLFHDREIVNRVDDSVVRVMCGKTTVLRRARGYAPAPLILPRGFEQARPLMAMGGELKSTFCLLDGAKAVLSQHIGDLEETRTNADYQKNLELYQSLFQHKAQSIVVDQHPDYLSTKLGRMMADDLNLSCVAVQHHHAHIAACLADNDWPIDGPAVLGIALDGMGYGEGGCLWGGEFILADYCHYKRLATFKPVAMLGGAQAMRQPWRNTYAQIAAATGFEQFQRDYGNLELTKFLLTKPLPTFEAMLKTSTAAPLISSCGRLFDAVAAALSICRDHASYEGQAAIELEAIVDRGALEKEDDCLSYPFSIMQLIDTGMPCIEPKTMWQVLFRDLAAGAPVGVIAARFHKGLATGLVSMVERLTGQEPATNVKDIALSGGVFQNKILLEQVVMRLERRGFHALIQSKVPSNDGGLSLGQATIAAARQIKAGGY